MSLRLSVLEASECRSWVSVCFMALPNNLHNDALDEGACDFTNYVYTYGLVCVRACVRTCVRACVRTCVRACVRAVCVWCSRAVKQSWQVSDCL